MSFERELKFAEKILEHWRVKVRYISQDTLSNHTAGLSSVGLSDVLKFKFDDKDLWSLLSTRCENDTLYQISTPLLCNYFAFRLPNTEKPEFVYIGPYISKKISSKEIKDLAEQFHVSQSDIAQLEQFFKTLPLFENDDVILPILHSLAESIWGSTENYSFVKAANLLIPLPDLDPVAPAYEDNSPEDAQLTMKLLEERYDFEQQFMMAVANGQTNKAELLISTITALSFEKRSTSSLRNAKNYLVILNTLLRISARNGAVHPIHIDIVSSKYAKMIESLQNEAAVYTLGKEMVHKYCLLVKNHSMKGYSLLIRKILTRIDVDLTADLSLKTQAELLNVNPSYLSTLFKKETGYTLTEYVNKKRIENAILLLNTTAMQIQEIAQYCGIPDVNYFTKIFKKQIGKTPKEYRDFIS